MWAIPVLNGNANKDCYCYCIPVFCKTTLNCLEYSQQKMFWVDIVSFSLVKNLYFYTVMPTFVLHTLMCLKSISRPFTVENLPWKKRNILLGPCLDNMAAE